MLWNTRFSSMLGDFSRASRPTLNVDGPLRLCKKNEYSIFDPRKKNRYSQFFLQFHKISTYFLEQIFSFTEGRGRNMLFSTTEKKIRTVLSTTGKKQISSTTGKK